MKLLEIGQLENMDWTLDRTLDWTWTGLGLDLDWTWTGLATLLSKLILNNITINHF